MPKLIKHDRVIDDRWTLLGADAALGDVPATGPVLVPLRLWQAERSALLARGEIGVWLAPDEDPSKLAEDVAQLPVIAVDFPKFGDGRGFSTARLLRDRYGFAGELRAVGDIFRDQLFYLRECGFDAADSLRIEAGHILFTRELATPVTPFELGLARLVDFYRSAFRGGPALRAQRWQPRLRRLVGLLPAAHCAGDPRLPAQIRRGTAVMTSTCWSPLLERRIGLGFVNNDDAYPGATVMLAGGTRARVARLPFYDPAKSLPRRMQ